MADESLPLDRSPVRRLSLDDWVSPLTGLGQIMFQNSPLTGAFFLAGIAIVSPLMAAGAALAAVIGTLTAYVCRLDLEEIRSGLYGFNAGLVGIAVLANCQPTLLAFVLLVIGSFASALLTWSMRRRVPFPTYTLPFIVTTWLALYAAHHAGLPAVVAPVPAHDEPFDMTSAVIKGISEVMFQANVLTGALFLVGIMLCSWKGAFWAVIGSLAGVMVGVSHNAPEENLSLGLYGYNAALAAMALALYRPSVMLPLMAAVISIPFTEKFPLLGLPTLTAPFVLASWTIIALDRLDARLYDKPQRAEG